MNLKKAAVTTGAVVIGATGLNDTATEVFTDIFTWLHVAHSHPGAWAGLAIIFAGTYLHNHESKPSDDKTPPTQQQ